MFKISYIIGYRHDDFRLRNLQIVIEWLKKIKRRLLKYDIDFKIIIVEQDECPKLVDIDESIKYIFVYNNGYYNRGWGFNVGFQFLFSDYYFFADCDIVMQIDDCVDLLMNCSKYDAVNPYTNIYDSTDDYVKKIDLYNLREYREFPERLNTCFSGGICGLSISSMRLIAGWDERFRGRGWEDYAFTAKINIFLNKIHTFRYKAIHLWHPFETNTTKEINEGLNNEYINYRFDDYLDIILKSPAIGSFIKYSCVNKNTIRYNKNYLSKRRIQDARYKYKSFFNKVFSKDKDFYNKDVYVLLSGLNERGDKALLDSGTPTPIPPSPKPEKKLINSFCYIKNGTKDTKSSQILDLYDAFP